MHRWVPVHIVVGPIVVAAHAGVACVLSRSMSNWPPHSESSLVTSWRADSSYV